MKILGLFLLIAGACVFGTLIAIGIVVLVAIKVADKTGLIKLSRGEQGRFDMTIDMEKTRQLRKTA